MNDDVFPRRNLSNSEYWGRVVEDRIKALDRSQYVADMSLAGISRASQSGSTELAQNLTTLQEQFEQTRLLVAQLPATGSVATYNSGFGLTTGWQTVVSGIIQGIEGKRNLGISAVGVVRVVDTGEGTPDPDPPPQGGTFSWPFPLSSVTSEYGPRNGRMHQGIDFGQPEGRAIPAANAGTVIGNGYGSGTGYFVDLRHDNNIVTRYFHMVVRSDYLPIGSTVTKGQTIGRVGNTGNSFGDHLHWETIVNGTHWNPRDFMAAYGDGGTAFGGGSPGGSGTVPVFGRPRARMVLNGLQSREFFPHRDLTPNEGTLNQLFPVHMVRTVGDNINVDIQVYVEADVPASPGNFARLTVKGIFENG